MGQPRRPLITKNAMNGAQLPCPMASLWGGWPGGLPFQDRGRHAIPEVWQGWGLEEMGNLPMNLRRGRRRFCPAEWGGGGWLPADG